MMPYLGILYTSLINKSDIWRDLQHERAGHGLALTYHCASSVRGVRVIRMFSIQPHIFGHVASPPKVNLTSPHLGNSSCLSTRSTILGLRFPKHITPNTHCHVAA